jgi:hypothetical protein
LMLALTKDQVRAATHMVVSEADINDALSHIAEVAKARSR